EVGQAGDLLGRHPDVARRPGAARAAASAFEPEAVAIPGLCGRIHDRVRCPREDPPHCSDPRLAGTTPIDRKWMGSADLRGPRPNVPGAGGFARFGLAPV